MDEQPPEPKPSWQRIAFVVFLGVWAVGLLGLLIAAVVVSLLRQ